jgi:thermostable 8-oxoguanine DNA glycosylase
MSQIVRAFCAGEVRHLTLPPADTELVSGVRWGSAECLFTPAFWAAHAWQCSLAGQLPQRHRLGSTWSEEIAACLLGGYGVPAEVGLAAYERVRGLGLVNGSATEAALHRALSVPLCVNGRSVRYRFVRQKAAYLAATLRAVEGSSGLQALTDTEFRNWFTTLPGVGLKTASWITRNLRDSDAVAIIDVHVYRAGRLAGIFPASATIARDYESLERQFLAFAGTIAVRASQLDALIWDFMKRIGSFGVSAFRRIEEDDLSSRFLSVIAPRTCGLRTHRA